jgi:hypothetical protein
MRQLPDSMLKLDYRLDDWMTDYCPILEKIDASLRGKGYDPAKVLVTDSVRRSQRRLRSQANAQAGLVTALAELERHSRALLSKMLEHADETDAAYASLRARVDSMAAQPPRKMLTVVRWYEHELTEAEVPKHVRAQLSVTGAPDLSLILCAYPLDGAADGILEDPSEKNPYRLYDGAQLLSFKKGPHEFFYQTSKEALENARIGRLRFL